MLLVVFSGVNEHILFREVYCSGYAMLVVLTIFSFGLYVGSRAAATTVLPPSHPSPSSAASTVSAGAASQQMPAVNVSIVGGSPMGAPLGRSDSGGSLSRSHHPLNSPVNQPVSPAQQVLPRLDLSRPSELDLASSVWSLLGGGHVVASLPVLTFYVAHAVALYLTFVWHNYIAALTNLKQQLLF